MSTILAFYLWLLTSVSGAVAPGDTVQATPAPPPAPAQWLVSSGNGFSNGI